MLSRVQYTLDTVYTRQSLSVIAIPLALPSIEGCLEEQAVPAFAAAVAVAAGQSDCFDHSSPKLSPAHSVAGMLVDGHLLMLHYQYCQSASAAPLLRR